MAVRIRLSRGGSKNARFIVSLLPINAHRVMADLLKN